MSLFLVPLLLVVLIAMFVGLFIGASFGMTAGLLAFEVVLFGFVAAIVIIFTVGAFEMGAPLVGIIGGGVGSLWLIKLVEGSALYMEIKKAARGRKP